MAWERFRCVLLGLAGGAILLGAMSTAHGQDKAATSAETNVIAKKARVIKKDKIVFLGNSITLHGPSESIGWTGNWGMAASAEEKDYVHIMVKALSNPAPGANANNIQTPKYLVKNIADFERGFADFPVEENLKDFLEFKPDLIVLAIGENVAPLNTEDLKAQFHDRVAKLLKAFQKNGDPTIVVRSSFWASPEKDLALKQAAEDVGAIFVDISKLGGDETNFARSERKIAHAGVAGHPGDKGMNEIAVAILDAISKAEKP